jgi:hypothetical protein
MIPLGLTVRIMTRMSPSTDQLDVFTLDLDTNYLHLGST